MIRYCSYESLLVSAEASQDGEFSSPVPQPKQTGRPKLFRKLIAPAMVRKTSFRGLFGKLKTSEADSVSGYSEVAITVHSER